MPPKKKQCVRTKLKKKRVDYQNRRQQETTSDEEGRRRRDRMSRALSRALENEAERSARRTRNRTSTAESRALENEEDRSARRTRNRTSTAESRALENEEERSSRRTRDRTSTAESRALENEEERSARRTRDRISTRNSRVLIWRNKENSAFFYDPSIDYASDPSIVIGSMSITCPHCEGLKWKGETPGMCCSGGKVRLRPLNDPPETLQSLLTDDTADALHFRNNIRSYNSCFQMTSFGASKEVREPGYMPTFKVQGQVYHLIGSLQPLSNEEPKFLQIYFVGDNVQQANLRCKNVPRVKQDIILLLQEMLHQENIYVNSFKLAMEKLTPELNLIILADKTPKGEHERRYNAPTTSEVAIIMSGEQYGTRDIILETKCSSIKKIADTHRSYDTLQYPLIFWQGEDGYNFLLQQFNPSAGLFTNRKISAMDFYAFRMMVRPSSFNIILKCKDLFHQYIVDMYAKIESERLRYILLNQKTLRVEQYAHLKDAVVNDGNVANIGQLIILPSSFTGGPRYMHERTQDAMAYVRNYGRPDLFITFTCNPTWEEIQNELFSGQKPQDRHDLLARVFHQKHKALMSLITKGKIFGNVRCFMYTIEWQKRGLPHAHILLWLQDTIHVHRVDDFIKAEIPDSVEDPNLFSIVTTQMVHGPCGSMNTKSPCMKNGKCTKRYPRGFLKETQTGQDGYPLYRRRSPEDGGFTATVTVRRSEVFVDNRWIVPYCPLLSRIFKAHINVEFCNSVKSIKYVCKYVNKGSDMAVFDVSAGSNERNEVHNYQMGRYISSNEAVWRILNFPIHERHPTVVHLSVHLENGQRVYFTTANAAEKAQIPQPTTLTAFFTLCTEDDFACTLLYHQVPKYYTWNNSTKKWNRRKIGNNVENQVGIKSSDALGRVYTVHPNNSECFHLRLLLHEVRGATSFQHLKTFGENICETYKEACQLRGLLEDDQHWNTTLAEAAASRSPKMMRDLFAVMLQICSMSTPHQLWLNHREQLSEDLLHQARIQHQNMELSYNDDIFNKALIILEDKVKSLGGTDLKTLGLPQPVRQPHDSSLSDDVFRELNYDTAALTEFINENEPKLVADQREAFSKILNAVFTGCGGMFFLDAPGGTGKTFLINLILAKVRQRKEIALAVASSGIAATLLSGGRTAHSTFKLPLNLASTESPTCSIKKNSGRAKVLQQCKLIVWDECTMSHKVAFEALDKTMQDLKENKNRMGGITVVLAGDFRQTLPVIPRGTRADEMQACVKSSYIWRDIKKLGLTTNMRVHVTGYHNAQQFANNLLQLGNGNMSREHEDGSISVEGIGNIVGTQQELKEAVFTNLAQHFKNPAWLRERAILAPKNDAVNLINKQLLYELPGDLQLYKSVDTTSSIEDAISYPTEFLNSLDPPGVPSHRLELKIGAPIMLLRNLDPPKLCNGTRLTVKKLLTNVITATIMTGHSAGEDVLLPRIPIIPSDVPFQFKRLQFPIRLSFAMSINKAQGQSLKIVGLNLMNPCFSHGQLYVGCSRVGMSENLHIFAPNGRTVNIVYPEALIH